MTSNQKIIILSKPKNSSSALRKILEENGLKEDIGEYTDKVDQEMVPCFDVLYKLIRDFFSEEINETLFISNAQKELNISEQVAKNIFKDVKNKISPFVVMMSEKEIEEQNGTIPTSTQSVKQAMKDAIYPSQEPKKIVPEFKIEHPVPVKKKMERPTQAAQQQIKRDDTYREPIE